MTRIRILLDGHTDLEYDPKAPTVEIREQVGELLQKGYSAYEKMPNGEGEPVTWEFIDGLPVLPDTDNDLLLIFPISGG